MKLQYQYKIQNIASKYLSENYETNISLRRGIGNGAVLLLPIKFFRWDQVKGKVKGVPLHQQYHAINSNSPPSFLIE